MEPIGTTRMNTHPPEDKMTKRWSINTAVRFAPLFTQQAVWVKNAISGITQPYIVAKSTQEAISGLVADKSSVATLDSSVIRELTTIGVILDDSSIQNDKDSWSGHLVKTKGEL